MGLPRKRRKLTEKTVSDMLQKDSKRMKTDGEHAIVVRILYNHVPHTAADQIDNQSVGLKV